MSDPTYKAATPTSKRRRKLKALVITMPGSERKAKIEDLFAQPSMKDHFEAPSFSDAVDSRDLKNRFKFFLFAHQAGLIPEAEWEALQRAHADEALTNSEKFFDCLDQVPVIPGRRGSKTDVNRHYSTELWWKAKTINRGRTVLGCTFAHLIALKRFIAEGFDVILEDNVRAPISGGECADRVWQSMEAMHEMDEEKQQQLEGNTDTADKGPHKCHFRFQGWLGSVPNIEWILKRHTPKRGFQRECNLQQQSSLEDDIDIDLDVTASNNPMRNTVVPFPKTQDILEDLKEMEELERGAAEERKDNGEEKAVDEIEGEEEGETKIGHTKPGGNPVWGSYAYWISEEGYKALLARLQNDVGAMLWKGKRMRYHLVKPIDKVLPRLLMDHFGRQDAVQLSTFPAFFRAPMLTSKIHTKYDPEFCKSTEFQLANAGGLTWSDLWLTKDEREIIAYRERHGEWITQGRLQEMREE